MAPSKVEYIRAEFYKKEITLGAETVILSMPVNSSSYLMHWRGREKKIIKVWSQNPLKQAPKSPLL